MTDVKDLLPIGSIVLLKEGEKRLMVAEVLQRDGKTGKEYDYLGLLYPEGHVGPREQYLFNHGDVAQVCFRGFSDAEREGFLRFLEEEPRAREERETGGRFWGFWKSRGKSVMEALALSRSRPGGKR